MIERIIVLAQQLEKLNNFNGVKEVLAGLQSSAVYRLKKTREVRNYQSGFISLSKGCWKQVP